MVTVTSIPEKYCGKCKQFKTATSEHFNRNRNNKDGLQNQCRDCQRNADKGRNKAEEHQRNANKKALHAQGMKQCSRCKEVKPFEDFYKGHSGSLTNRKSWCKKCYAEKMGWEWQPRQSFPTPPPNHKYCRRCGIVKPLEQFYDFPTTHNRDGKASYCIECLIEKGRSHRIRKGVKVRQKRADGLHECRVCHNLYPRTPEYFYRKGGFLNPLCKPCSSELGKTYGEKEAYKHRRRVSSNNRRARKLSLPDTFTFEEWQSCLEYFSHRCAVCGRENSKEHPIVQDHWIPIKQTENNPGTVATNIVPLCHTKVVGLNGCNNSKNYKHPFEWLVERFGVEEATRINDRIQAYFDYVRSK